MRKAARDLLIATVVFGLTNAAHAQLGAMVPNWTVPSSSGSHTGAITTMGDITFGLAFIGVTPCRIVDTRGPTGPFGGPKLTSGVVRNFALASGPCTGIPSSVAAYSLNITVTNTLGAGFIEVWPQGGSVPGVSTLNYEAAQTVANAAVVPAGTGGGISVVAGVHGTDLIIDINGYFIGGTGSLLNTGEYVGWEGNYSFGGVVYGQNTNSGGYGVNGVGAGIGVYGQSLGSGISFAGVWGTSTDAIGTYGLSTNENGVWAQSTNWDALAAFGGRHGAFLQGAAYGAVGSSTGTAVDLAGVLGFDSTGRTPGSGHVTSGVRGESLMKYGVFGLSRDDAGVAGELVDSLGNISVFGLLGTGPYGVYSGGEIGATGKKLFVEPHPTDPSKVIRYVCLEGPESGTYFRGSGQILNGTAVIDVPESFRMVSDTDGLTVQLTPVGDLATMAVVSEDLNQIVVRSSSDVRFHYLVNGVRKAFKDHQAISEGKEFMPRSATETMPGYLTAEAKSRLIANGTYNADGTVNMATAERVGWTKIWADREQASKDAAAKSAQEIAKRYPGTPQRQD